MLARTPVSRSARASAFRRSDPVFSGGGRFCLGRRSSDLPPFSFPQPEPSMTLLRLALAALFACALFAVPADARAPGGQGGPNGGSQGHQGGHQGGHGHGGHGQGDHGGGGKGGGPEPAAPSPSPSSPAAESGGAGGHDGADTRGDASRRQFCYRHPGDYWCKEGGPVILAPKRP